MDNLVPRVIANEAARAVIRQLIAQHGPLLFHQSGGCCDGSSPMCFTLGELLISDNDVWLGQVESCDFYMSSFQYDYWKHTQLELDVVQGRGASFSLEIPLGLRFVIKSRLFTETEEDHLSPIRYGE